jgi:hypothetical protein
MLISERQFKPSKVRMSGFGSNACCDTVPGPDLLFAGIALSDRLSTKSFTIKSLLENVSMLKVGALGKILALPEPEVCAIAPSNEQNVIACQAPCTQVTSH